MYAASHPMQQQLAAAVMIHAGHRATRHQYVMYSIVSVPHASPICRISLRVSLSLIMYFIVYTPHVSYMLICVRPQASWSIQGQLA